MSEGRSTDAGPLVLRVVLVLVVVTTLVVWANVSAERTAREELREAVERGLLAQDRLRGPREPLWWPSEPGDGYAAYRRASELAETWYVEVREFGWDDEDELIHQALARIGAGRGESDAESRRRLLAIPAVAESLAEVARGSRASEASVALQEARYRSSRSSLTFLPQLAAAFVARLVERVDRGDDHSEAVRELLPIFQCAVDVVADPFQVDGAAFFALPPQVLEAWLGEGRYGDLDASARSLLREVLADVDDVLSRPIGYDTEVAAHVTVFATIEGLARSEDAGALAGPEAPLRRREGSPARAEMRTLAEIVEQTRRVRTEWAADPDATFARLRSGPTDSDDAEEYGAIVGRQMVGFALAERALFLHDLRALRIALARIEGDAAFTLEDPYGSGWVVRDDGEGVRVRSDSAWNEGAREVFVAR